LNRPDDIRPDLFLSDAVQQINRIFQTPPSGSTPYARRIQESFFVWKGRRVAWYFFGDGVPDGGQAAIRQIEQMVMHR
jgi:hypothetical protein